MKKLIIGAIIALLPISWVAINHVQAWGDGTICWYGQTYPFDNEYDYYKFLRSHKHAYEGHCTTTTTTQETTTSTSTPSTSTSTTMAPTSSSSTTAPSSPTTTSEPDSPTTSSPPPDTTSSTSPETTIAPVPETPSVPAPTLSTAPPLSSTPSRGLPETR